MITLNDSVLTAVQKLSEGNPGAVRVCMEVLKHPNGGLMRLLDIDDMGMKGSSIWLGYKDHCKEDLPTFLKALGDRDASMVATIRAAGGEAWTGGRS